MGERLGGWLRRPRRLYFAVALPLAIPLLLATYPTAQSAMPRAAAPAAPAPELRYADLVATPDAHLPAHSLILTLEDGDTLDSILAEGGLTRGESALLNNRFGQFVDLRRLRPGHLLRFHYGPGDRVDAVQMKVLGWGLLDAVRNGETFDITPRQADMRELETDIAATIDTSLYEALRQAGEGPQLAQQLVDVFQWDIDFFALKKGDSFSLVVTKRFAGSDLVGYGPIKGARFTHEGITYEAFRHQSADGRAGYYARVGMPLRKQFLRAPLQFTRITSGFSKKRFHPLLHYFRPHHGVDYGAPTGTPVMTTADGVVLEAGSNGGEGNFVRIRHTSRIETSYLHLSRFAKGIKRGTKVTQGDVIGYVGMTGLATGPHLDYRVSDNGTWLDPLKLKSITPDPLAMNELRTFRANVAHLSPRLNAPSAQLAQAAPKRRALF
ncbi:MAG TPA: peptidoglycan DD-metalloendopeptidase family protein [Thermoanaerobaculia bacterium]|nr:peptidoglycan DD-metalloendopeptidase family protein [Thermoanaerobaculia bacterium]